MRTTIDLPDALFRRSKAAAALAGVSLRELFTAALTDYLHRQGEAVPESSGWRVVFAKGDAEAVAEVDRVVAAELGNVDPGDWE